MNKLRLFNHIGHGEFKLLIESQTILEENEDYELKEMEEYIANDILSKEMLSEDLDCIVMINNQALYRFEITEKGSYFCDCIEGDFMLHFVEWYRKEYNDDSFNGSNFYAKSWKLTLGSKQMPIRIINSNFEKAHEEDIKNIISAIQLLEKVKDPKIHSCLKLLENTFEENYIKKMTLNKVKEDK
jgi:hypothetical protein